MALLVDDDVDDAPQLVAAGAAHAAAEQALVILGVEDGGRRSLLLCLRRGGRRARGSRRAGGRGGRRRRGRRRRRRRRCLGRRSRLRRGRTLRRGLTGRTLAAARLGLRRGPRRPEGERHGRDHPVGSEHASSSEERPGCTGAPARPRPHSAGPGSAAGRTPPADGVVPQDLGEVMDRGDPTARLEPRLSAERPRVSGDHPPASHGAVWFSPHPQRRQPRINPCEPRMTPRPLSRTKRCRPSPRRDARQRAASRSAPLWPVSWPAVRRSAEAAA